MPKRELIYNKLLNTVFIDAKEEEFVPEYLKYLLEYLKIPADVKIEFIKK